MSSTTCFWMLLYRLALTGRLGCLEAGYDGTLWARLTPLDYKLHQFLGTIWVRERLCPLAPDKDSRLTAFAAAAADKPTRWVSSSSWRRN